MHLLGVTCGYGGAGSSFEREFIIATALMRSLFPDSTSGPGQLTALRVSVDAQMKRNMVIEEFEEMKNGFAGCMHLFNASCASQARVPDFTNEE